MAELELTIAELMDEIRFSEEFRNRPINQEEILAGFQKNAILARLQARREAMQYLGSESDSGRDGSRGIKLGPKGRL